ncbi:homocysteine S-methyltransferase family protein [Rhodobacteraceae bacterium NNCM2]|nr:homocysteine S-methyltransferase family protein [Coraliihabitans acroporae]
MPRDFTEQPSGLTYLTEGGTETEIMFRHGHDFPHFAMFELLKNPAAMTDLHDMYKRYLDVAAEAGVAALVSGLDYRASPDWGSLLGYSTAGLAQVQAQCIDFIRNVAAPYRSHLPDIRYAGVIGPRGDAYALNRTITAEEAEDYHSTQLETLKALEVDLAWAATFNNVPEAVGVARAASRIGVPVCISFTLTSEHRLRSGPTLQEAVKAVDAATGNMRPMGYGINCSHPAEYAPAIEPGDWFQRMRSIRPNAAKMDKIALCKLNHLEEGDPVELGQQLGDLAARNPQIDIWGGCCGTWDKHLREIAGCVAGVRTG